MFLPWYSVRYTTHSRILLSMFPVINATLFAVQLYVNRIHGRQIGPASRRNHSLIAPAPYAFAIWGVIYAMLASTVYLDCIFPDYSFFSSHPNPTFLRVVFACSCLANISWIFAFPRNKITLSTILIYVLWLSVGLLYANIILKRRDSQDAWSWIRFIGSELAILLYFAWLCVASVVMTTIRIQQQYGEYLPTMYYVGILAGIVFVSISINLYLQDAVFSGVTVWALLAIAHGNGKLHNRSDDKVDVRKFGIHCCALQGAIVISCFTLLKLVIA